MIQALKAGAVYVALVFLAGFGLGVLRVLVVAPRLGAVVAVLIEAPAILVISWAVCRGCVARFGVAPAPGPRLMMGGSAFVLLMGLEVALSVLAFGRSLAEHLGGYLTLPGALGLAAQLGFAAIPLIQLRRL
jgi:hypothetical protein